MRIAGLPQMIRARQHTVKLLIFALAGLSLRGQDYARVAPKAPQAVATSAAALPAPGVIPAPVESKAPLGVALKGLVFLDSVQQFVSGGWPMEPAGVDITRVTELTGGGFEQQMQPYIGRQLSLDELARLRTATLNWLRTHKRSFVDVAVPPQNLSSGVVQVVVTEYRLGHIEIRGARYFSPAQILANSGLRPGQKIQMDDLQADLDRLNRNPFLNVDAVFQPGSQTSETDLELKARDQLPLRVYSGFDNFGSRGLGTQEWNTGVNWGNVFGTGQIVSYQYTRSTQGAFESHSLSDSIPLKWGDQLLIFGSYAVERPLLSKIFSDLGHSGQASIRYVHALRRVHRLTQQIEAGYDFKTTDNNLEFAGFHIFGSQGEVDQFPLIYDVNVPDSHGQTAIQNTFVYSPGKISPDNTTAALASLVPGAHAAYLYNRFMVTRTTPLSGGFSSITRLTSQRTDHNLPYSEQIGGGGVGSVRGYYSDTAFGSNGELFSEELRFPSFVGSKLLDRHSRWEDKAQFGVFFDYADLRTVTPIPDEKKAIELASVGFLARYTTTHFFDFEFDVGRRLITAPTVPRIGCYGQISITGRF